MSVVDRIRDLVAPIIEAEPVELYDIEYNGGVLRVTVESPDGVDITVIKRISRSISHELDETDPISGRFTLEVSSPGLERSLRTPEHFLGAVGVEVKVKTAPNVEGDRRVRGVLHSADDEGFEIETDNGRRRLSYDDVAKARTVFEWGPTPKPGGKPDPRSQSTTGKPANGPSTTTKKAPTS